MPLNTPAAAAAETDYVGKWDLLDSQTLGVAASSMDFETGFDDDVYDKYVIVLTEWRPAADAQLHSRVKVGGSYASSANNYAYRVFTGATTVAGTWTTGENGTEMYFTGGTQDSDTGSSPLDLEIEFGPLSGTDRYKLFRARGHGGAQTTVTRFWESTDSTGFYRAGTDAVQGIQFYYNGQNIRAGAIGRLFGRRKVA